MRFVFTVISVSVLLPALAYSVVWGTLALWFKFTGPEWLKWVVCGVFAFFGLGTIIAMFTRVRWRWLVVFATALVALNLWWNTLVPPSDGNWSPEVAQQVTGSIEEDILTLKNVRNFDWRSETDVTETWETRSYDISKIESVDLFMSYWGGPSMAHLILSFGFADGQYLAWSNEVRREKGVSFSPVADFFKAHSIAVVASEEKDVVGLRSNIQNARVHIFRLNSVPENRRRLIEGYVAAANAVAEKPHWFHSVFTNCSRTVVQLARYVGIEVPMDWKIIVNGYFPYFLYDHGAMNTDLSIEEIYQLGDITEKAQAFGLAEGFSEAIRQGVPRP